MRVGSDNEIKLAANKLVDSFKVRTDAYPTNTLMWPWGHDFQFTKAHKMFDSMDKIIDYINSHPEYEVCLQKLNVLTESIIFLFLLFRFL